VQRNAHWKRIGADSGLEGVEGKPEVVLASDRITQLRECGAQNTMIDRIATFPRTTDAQRIVYAVGGAVGELRIEVVQAGDNVKLANTIRRIGIEIAVRVVVVAGLLEVWATSFV
jgi:hypothetical protein